MFSRRTPPLHAPNRLTQAVASQRAPFVDLTVTNPTVVGLPSAPERLSALADRRGQVYNPEPKGLLSARRAVARAYGAHGVAADPGRIVLTASSSEAYGWLFKLLCESGDAVLVPAPSYPLLDALVELECVELHRYPLDPAHGWAFQASVVGRRVEELALTGTRVKAVVVVNPNNPTGTSIEEGELLELLSLGRRLDFAVISDEVFLDYRFDERPGEVRVAARHDEGLVFSLGGLSKSAALPQLKLGWILVNGPSASMVEALERLEWIADAYLSVGTPVQLALPDLLSWSAPVTRAVTRRVAGNARALRHRFPPGSAAEAQLPRAGWSGVLRVPAVVPEEELVLGLLSRYGVLVHPGYFFEFPHEAFLVLSLLPDPDVFQEGVSRLASGLKDLLAA